LPRADLHGAVGGGEMAAKRRRYSGELAAPIVRPAPPAFEGAVTDQRVEKFWRDYSKHERKAEQIIKQKLLQKITLLMEYYGIRDQNDMPSLALALASAHVPGFKVIPERVPMPKLNVVQPTDGIMLVPETQTKKGRKRQWDGPRLTGLFEIVSLVKSRHNLSDKQALKFIVNNPQHASIWGPAPGHKGSKQQWIETLESRLQDAKRYVCRRAALREIFRK
jgi:hypothetical protein